MSSKIRRGTRAVIAAATTAAVAAGLAVGLSGSPEAATAANAVTITPNPWAASTQPFQGWGTSLAWFANATGGYPDALKQQLYQAIFGTDGLDLNIARYNIGAGNASDVADYLRPGGAVQGWWQPDATGSAGTYGGTATTVANTSAILNAFDPNNSADYNWNADQTQRWWVQQLAADKQISHWEAFANSAPYFMTQSGYVSGNTNASADNLAPAAYSDYASYLTHVTDYLEQTYGISFDSIEPFNEPNTSYWGTTLKNGVPQPGGQEGMHVSPSVQAAVIPVLKAALANATTHASISAMDETNTSTFLTDVAAYSASTMASVGRLNVHSYGTGSILQARDAAKSAKKPLWMSEVEGSWVNGYDPVNIQNGLGLAQKINDDLRQLQPEAWTLWQPVENLYNMQQTEKLNWGEVYVDFDCKPYSVNGQTVWESAQRVADAGGDASKAPACGVQYSSKYNAMRSYTHFIHEGDHLMPTNDSATTAAVSADGSGASLVHVNNAASSQTVTIDLSGFGSFAANATVTPYVTTQGTSATDPTPNALVRQSAVAVNPATRTATYTVPANSITSFVVSGASGVSAAAPQLADGHDYQLVGVQSGKALTANTSGTAATTITSAATTASAAPAQKWTAHIVPSRVSGTSGQEAVLTTADGQVLGATSAGTDLRTLSVADATANANTRWMVETTDGRTFSLVNEAISQSLDIGGQSTAENAPVGVYGSNGGANQSWSLRDLAPSSATQLAVHTSVGSAPALPATAAPTYSWGAGQAVPVTWSTPDASTWNTPGQVSVTGTATDVFGSAFTVTATVDVGDFTLTDPASIAAYAGQTTAAVTSQAPTTVVARVGGSNQSFSAPVTWDWSKATDAQFATAGTAVTVTGAADIGSGKTIPATLWVEVTPAGSSNVLLGSGITETASSTESSSYPISNTTNGNLTDKGWSNWVSTNKPAQSTLTYTFDRPHTLTSADIRFYRDGANSWAQSLQFLYRDPASGNWLPVPGYESAVAVVSPGDGSAPIVTANFAPAIAATGLRVVMNTYPGSYLTVSEVEAFEPKASATANTDLGAIRVGAQSVADVSGATTDYAVTDIGTGWPAVQGYAIDPGARVNITQPSDASGGVATIVVASSDGTAQATYRVHVTVLRPQSIAFPSPGDTAVGAKDLALTATASSGLAVTYTVAGPCAIVNGALHATAPGTCAITAAQPGDAHFAAASSVSDVVAIAEGTVALTAPPVSANWGTAAKVTVTVDGGTVAATGTVNLAEGSTDRGTAALAGGSATLTLPVGLAGGAHTLTVRYSGDQDFAAATVRTTVTVVLPPAWSTATAYQAGDIVSYAGQVYKAGWYTKGEKPGTSNTGAWQQLAMTEGGATSWTSSRVFLAGDTAVYQGKTFRAAWYSRNDTPGSVTGPWEEIATAPDGTALWTPSRIFNTGDKALYNGVTYVANWYSRDTIPGAAKGAWTAAG